MIDILCHAVSSARRVTVLAILTFTFSSTSGLAATLTVNSLADNTISGDGLVTLREAVIAAVNDTTTDLGQTGTANDIIDLSGLSGTILLTSPLPTISNTITFSGPGHDVLTVDGGGVQTFLTMDAAANVNLTGLTIANCYRALHGGAVSTQGVLTASHCRFTANKSKVMPYNLNSMGSAIYGGSASSSIQLTDCVISHNEAEATPTGGTQYFIGSAVGSLGGTINIVRCTFDSNSTLIANTSTGGGGMGHSLGIINGGSINLIDSTIKNGYFQQPLNNHTSWGSVYVGNSGSRFTAEGSTWNGNTGYPVTGVYSISSSVSQSPIQLLNCTFSENGNHEAGATFFINGSVRLTLEHCTVANNRSRAGFPASIEMIPGSSLPQVQITNSVLASADKIFQRFEIRNNSGGAINTNGYNFIADPGTAILSPPANSYGNTMVTKVSELVNPLGDNGGHTQTCSLPDGSLLIDAANPTGFAATDQRDVVRPRNGDLSGGAQPDIGAYERFDGNLKVTKTANRAQAAVGNSLSYVLTVRNEHPSETASGIEVKDVLPPNLQFVNTAASQFSSVDFADGILTAKRATLAPGASASVTINCIIMPYQIENVASARQLGYETDSADNVATAVTSMMTPPVPRVVSFVPVGENPTSAETPTFRLTFDRNIMGLDVSDFTFIPAGGTSIISAITPVVSFHTYDITVSGMTGDGALGLLLLDDDSIVTPDDLQPLNGPGNGGPYASTLLTIDRTAPVSNPIAAAVSPGETTTTKFFLLYTATDASGISDVKLYLRKGSSGAFQQAVGAYVSPGIFEVDTSLYGGYGTYELYTVATDTVGNVEARVDTPQISVTLNVGTPTAALDWQIYY